VSSLDLLNRAVLAAEQAGRYLRSVERPGAPAGWTLKGKPDYLTEVDRRAEQIIVDALSSVSPGGRIVGEELSPDLVTNGLVWIVDPLDGTKEFLAQNGEFSIMIGLAVRGEAVLGVVYLPALDVLYAAARGAGAWLERGGERVSLRRVPIDGKPIRLVGSRSHSDPLLLRIQESLGITDVRPSGSVGIKCGLVAEGERDLYVHPVPYLSEWDTCAPEAVLREAGGDVVDCLGGPLRYNKRNPKQPAGIIACAPGLRERVVQRVKPLFEETNGRDLD
jgi:3'(2'), 5'-bisphosphate nucleotidase